MSKTIAERRNWSIERDISPDIPLKSRGEENTRTEAGKMIEDNPNLIISIVYIPTIDELRTWEKEGYDGVLIIYDPIQRYEQGVAKGTPLDELVALGKSFFHLMTYYKGFLPTRSELQRFRQLTFVDGSLILFRQENAD